MMTTLSHLWFRPHGFDADGVTTFVVRLPRTRHTSPTWACARSAPSMPPLQPMPL